MRWRGCGARGRGGGPGQTVVQAFSVLRTEGQATVLGMLPVGTDVPCGRDCSGRGAALWGRSWAPYEPRWTSLDTRISPCGACCAQIPWSPPAVGWTGELRS